MQQPQPSAPTENYYPLLSYKDGVPSKPKTEAVDEKPSLYPPMPYSGDTKSQPKNEAADEKSSVYPVVPYSDDATSKPDDVVVVEQPKATTAFIVQQSALGPRPEYIVCPYCNQDILTKVEFQSTHFTHIAALLCCMTGIGMCCVPCIYCQESCLMKKHYCPRCKRFLGQNQ